MLEHVYTKHNSTSNPWTLLRIDRRRDSLIGPWQRTNPSINGTRLNRTSKELVGTGSICPYRNNLELNCQRPLSTIDRYYHSMSCNSCTWLRTRPTCSGAPDLMRDDETRTRTRRKRSTLSVGQRRRSSRVNERYRREPRVRAIRAMCSDPLKNHYGRAISAWHFFSTSRID